MAWRKKLHTAVKAAHAAYTRNPTGDSKKKSREIVQDCEASATLVTIATRHLLGPTFSVWEPETIWLELDPCLSNRDKLMASITLASTTAFYTDFRAFAAVIQACNGEAVTSDALPHCTPEQLAWGRFEAELLFSLHDQEDVDPHFDAAPAGFTAACLLNAGMVVTPPGLEFAEGALKDLLTDEAKELRKKVLKQEPSAEKTSEEINSALDVQVQRLKDIAAYLDAKADSLIAALNSF